MGGPVPFQEIIILTSEPGIVKDGGVMTLSSLSFPMAPVKISIISAASASI
jgi:hypothetical protein